MPFTGRSILRPFSDSEVVALLKPAVAYFTSPECVLKSIPEAYCQSSEVQEVHEEFKVLVDAAHPNDSKQVVDRRKAKRMVYNEKMGDFVDLVELGSRKDPSLLTKFNMEFLLKGRSKSTGKTNLNLVPEIILQAIDQQPETVHGKVRGGVRKAIEIFHAYDDPSNEANWSHFDSYASASFVMAGLTSGKRTYVKGRYIFGKGKKSPWSNMVSIMVP